GSPLPLLGQGPGRVLRLDRPEREASRWLDAPEPAPRHGGRPAASSAVAARQVRFHAASRPRDASASRHDRGGGGRSRPPPGSLSGPGPTRRRPPTTARLAGNREGRGRARSGPRHHALRLVAEPTRRRRPALPRRGADAGFGGRRMTVSPDVVTPASRPAEALGHYGAFGLLIRAELDLPGPERRPPGAPDLIVRGGGVERPLPDGATRFEFGEAQQYLAWPRVGHFLITGEGTEVRAEAGPDIEERFLNLALLGPVMATLLQLRGCLVLHGSAVEI